MHASAPTELLAPKTKGVMMPKGPIVYVYTDSGEKERPTVESVERMRHHLISNGVCTYNMVSTIMLPFYDKLVLMAIKYNPKTAADAEAAEARVDAGLAAAPSLYGAAAFEAPSTSRTRRREKDRHVNRTSLVRSLRAAFA